MRVPAPEGQILMFMLIILTSQVGLTGVNKRVSYPHAIDCTQQIPMTNTLAFSSIHLGISVYGLEVYQPSAISGEGAICHNTGYSYSVADPGPDAYIRWTTGQFTDIPPYGSPRCIFIELENPAEGNTCVYEFCLDQWPECGPVSNKVGNGDTDANARVHDGSLSLVLAPNPASTEVRAIWTADTESTIELMLHDSRGRLVQWHRVKGENGELLLRLDGLAKGIYLVRLVQQDGKFITEKLSVY